MRGLSLGLKNPNTSLCAKQTRSLWQELTAGGGKEQNRGLLLLVSLLKISIPRMFHNHCAKMEEKRSLRLTKGTMWKGSKGVLRKEVEEQIVKRSSTFQQWVR